MAQSIEVTEKVVNGKTLGTPLVKSLNTSYIERTQAVDASGTNDTEIFLGGRNTKDLRRVDETQAAVLAAMNAAPTTDIETGLSVTVKKKEGDLEERITPYLLTIAKSQIVEYYADPNDDTDSIIIVAVNDNSAERTIYTVDDTYAALKAKWLL